MISKLGPNRTRRMYLGKVKAEVKGNKLMFMANTEFAPGTGVVAWEIKK